MKKEMNKIKRCYLAPDVTVVQLSHRTTILTGSGGGGQDQGGVDPVEPGTREWKPESHSIWD